VSALTPRFYARPTAVVARRLLGQLVVSSVGGRRTAGRIVETEAYVGPHDPACHAFGHRRTARTATLYGCPGTAYVYFTYGMHWCLNAVTEPEGFPAAVLIRALEPVAGVAVMRRRRAGAPDRLLCAGPARLCAALGVTGALNGVSLTRGPLRIVRDPARHRVAVAVSTRIGVARAADWPLRFLVVDSPWVSRAPGMPASRRGSAGRGGTTARYVPGGGSRRLTAAP
jgi:DNA-3-methyladenine glycosylase